MTRFGRRVWVLGAGLAVLATAVACSSTKATTGGPSGPHSGSSSSSSGGDSKWFDQAEFDKELKQASETPVGDSSTPWTQAIDPSWVDTTKYKKSGPWHVCFSNASLTNPWRTTGFTTMKAEAKLHPEIGSFTAVDAGGQDDKQISDIQDLLTQNCSILIVSPNTTGPLTTIVKQACGKIPVIDFDRGVNTDCPVTHVHPIGGFLFGADGANFLVQHVKKGGKILALRILPGVDVLEQRWAAAQHIFKQAGLNVVGVQFTNDDPAKTKQIVNDYIQRYGTIDGVWLDAGDTSAAAGEAFQDAGMDVPPLTGEDNNAFLEAWQKGHWTAVGSTYPVYQWRTAIIAAFDILSGQRVPKEWVLPQSKITDENLSQYVAPDMPPTFYSTCGCQKMPGYPGTWSGK